MSLIFLLFPGYVGCMVPKDDTLFANPSYTWTETNMGITIEICVEDCRGRGLRFAQLHMENCFCSADLDNFIPTAIMDCDTYCNGNPYQECGGEDRGAFSVYDIGVPNSCKLRCPLNIHCS